MTGVVPVIPRFKFFDSGNNPLSGGTVTVYLAGTTTLASVFQDKALTSAQENPVELDANGEAVFWVDSNGTYKFLLKDDDGATVPGWPVDNVPGSSNMASATEAAREWATKTDAAVTGSLYSAKEYAQGTQASTGGSAKNWAQQTGADVTGASANDRSSKSWAQEDLAGATLGGSAKDWAQSASLPDGVSKSAKSYAEDSEAASQLALAAGNAFASTAAGLAATASGDVFSVATADPNTFTVYSNNAGAAVLIGTLSVADGDVFRTITADGLAWCVQDDLGRVALGVEDDGNVVAESMGITTLLVDSVNGVTGTALVDATETYDGIAAADYAYVIKDELGRVAIGIRTDGTVTLGTVDARGLSRAGTFGRYPGSFQHQVNYVPSMGQSNSQGNTATDLTTTQEYDNVGFTSLAPSPTEFLPLTLANTRGSGGTYKESPLYGALGNAKALILSENGISYTINDYLLVGANNGVGATAIAGLSQGTSSYNAVIGQVQAAFDIAAAQGKSMAFPAVLWTQGESDAALASGAYKTALRELVNDLNADGIAITGQTVPVRLISWQVTSVARNVALETLELANEDDRVHVACPAYIFSYGDTVHLDATSVKWLGGYYGLVYKRVVIDGKKWEPLQPVGHAVNGSTVDLIFNKTGLQLDTTLVPAQTNHGFSVSAGSISSVAVVAPNRVRLTLSGAPAVGTVISYGNNVCVGKSPYVGGAGNLRDSQGDTLTYTFNATTKRLDNWCVLFNYTL
jgi:hypothetical protein